VFVTPRVANSLGLRNKELRDVGESSIDSVWLGNPHIIFFAGGVMQIQTVYDVSNGRGVAKMFGVTAFLNGRAGIGDTVTAALRQAIHLAPAVKLHQLPNRLVVGHAVPIRFQVTNGLSETVRISSREGSVLSKRLRTRNGSAVVRWVPRKPGQFRLRVSVRGVDGSVVDDRSAITVQPGPPGGGPTVKVSGLPRAPVVGDPVRIDFEVTNAATETVRIESRDGSTLTWKRQVHAGRGAVNWVPQEPGPARLRIIVRGADGQAVEQVTNLTVRKPTARSARGPRAG
jgi:hypothetical protein